MRSGIVNLDALQPFQAVNLLSDPGHIAGPVIVPQAMQVVLNWVLNDGKTAHNVLYGHYTGAFPGNQAMANAIHTALSTGAAWTGLAAQLATTMAFTGVSLRDVNTPNNAIIPSNTAQANGASASTQLPSEVAAVITLRTAKTGQSNRGRTYLAGFATNAVGAGDIIAAAAVTAINNWALTIFSAMTGQGLAWHLGQPQRQAYTSPTTGRVFPDRPATSTPIATATCRDNHWDSQRRRGLR